MTEIRKGAYRQLRKKWLPKGPLQPTDSFDWLTLCFLNYELVPAIKEKKNQEISYKFAFPNSLENLEDLVIPGPVHHVITSFHPGPST